VHGSAARGFHGFAVIARKIEAIGREFEAHRNPNAWSFVHAAIITHSTPNAVLDFGSSEFL
jgi:hypothetical protein